MKNKLLLIVLIFSPLFSCQKQIPKSQQFKKQWFLMDTVIEVTVVGDDQKKSDENFEKAYNELKRLEVLFTGYDSTGEIWKLNNSEGKEFKASPEVYSLVKASIAFSEMSNGAFDISVWPLIRLWGFGQKDKELSPPDAKDINSILPVVDYRRIKLTSENQSIRFMKSGMGIDLGGIAKGYIIDKLAALLKKSGVNNFLINAGGNIMVTGLKEDGKKWTIGIKHPRKDGIIETLELTDACVSTSGDYERFFIKDGVRYHHIIDPTTGYPANECIGVTVITDSNLIPNSGTVSDVLSTAIFVLGYDRGTQFAKNFNGTKVIIITPDLKIIRN